MDTVTKWGRNTLMLALFFGPLLTAAAESAAIAVTPHTTVELVSEYETAYAGATQWIGIHFKPSDGWHVYWKNPGDSGLPPRVEFTASPEGSRFEALEFPTPERIPYGPLVNFGYGGEVLYPAQWTAPADLKTGGNLVITATVKWLICKQECVPGKATLTLRLPTSDAAQPSSASGTHTKLLSASVDSLPRAGDGKTRVAFRPDSDSLTIAYAGADVKNITKTALRSVYFFPEGNYGIAADAKQVVTRTKDGISIEIPRKEKKSLSDIRGVLKISDGKSYRVAETFVASSPIAPVAPVVPVRADTTLPLMLLFAFIGGLILNLMPCILPVLSIKVLGLANQVGATRSEVRRHGLVFTFGILVSFWILAAILIGLRASGQSLGWGFQLQSPVFVASLAVLFFLMALNLFGVFEIGDRWMGTGGHLAAKSGYAGSFFTGVLTTLAATPCSAPFMGSALGFALTQPSWVAVTVLTVLAFGLAFPYLLFSYLPGAARILPRPGPWMQILREVLAFPLVATVVWLASVIGNQAGTSGVVRLLGVLSLAAFVVWLVGKKPTRPSTKIFRAFLLVASGLFTLSVLGTLDTMRERMTVIRGGQSPMVHAPWREWTPDAQAAALAAGKTVLVNFTAEWCVTCKVNETVVFNRASVREALGRESVVAFLADWTNGDPAITEALRRVGRNSVPVYLLYRPGSSEPKHLPQILTVDGVLGDLTSSR